MARYGLATLLEKHPVGYKFAANDPPLHLTHVDALDINLELDRFAAKLKELLKNQQPFCMKTVDDTLYGPNKDILVTTLERTPECMSFHALIMDMLEKEGAVLKNPHFHRESFSPHITTYGSRRIPPGQDVYIRDISIGTKLDDTTHQILATIALRQA